MTPRKFRNAVAGASSSTEKGGSPLSTPDGIAPFINAKADLPMKQDFAVNSWFAIGHFQAEGRLLDYLYHVMIFPSPDGKPILQSVVSITDETTGWFQGTDIILPFKENGASNSGIDFAVPNGEMRGTLDDLTVKASLPDGAVDLHSLFQLKDEPEGSEE